MKEIDTNKEVAEYYSPTDYSSDLAYSYVPSQVGAYEKALGEFSDALDKDYSTYPSTPVTHLNIPDVRRASC